LLPALIFPVVLAGCASAVPKVIRTPMAEVPTVAQVQQTPNAYRGRLVRWGGTVLEVINREHRTDILILSRPLAADGRPRLEAEPDGRFIAEIVGFVEPAEVPQDRRLTLVGRISGVRVRPVGDYPYRYPVVNPGTRHLWPETAPPGVWPGDPRYGPPWCDPWFSPSWPSPPWFSSRCGPAPWGRPWYGPWGPW
jgi:outer membrane lipoprotein